MRLFGSLASAMVSTVAEDPTGTRWILRPFSNRPTGTNRTYCLQRANHLHLVMAFHLQPLIRRALRDGVCLFHE